MTNLTNLIKTILDFRNEVDYYQDNEENIDYELSFDIDDIEECIIPEEVIPREKILIDTDDNIIKRNIELFMKIIEESYQEKDLKLYFHNIKELKISSNFNLQRFLIKILYPNSISSYDSYKNEIMINNKNEMNNSACIFHELFHMSSTYKDDDKILVGFSQLNLNNNQSIGNGINEGYTEYLAQKHYPEEITSCSYPYEIQVINVLKEIIGEDKMTSLYLNGNLKELIYELSKYSSIDEVLDFLVDLDYITKNHYQVIDSNTVNIVNSTKELVDTFLAKIYINSKKDELDNIKPNNFRLLEKFKDDYEEVCRKGPKNRYISPREKEYNVDIDIIEKLLKEKGYYKMSSFVRR